MNKNFFQLFSALLLVTLALSACGSSAPEPERPPLRVEYSAWWGDYTLGVAQELGLFEKYGVKVEPVYYDVYSDSFPDMAAGKVDAGLFGMGEAITVSDTTNLKMVAIYDNGGVSTVVARSEITDPADLEGQRIGVLLGTSYELYINEVLKLGGLTKSDVTMVNLSPEEVVAALQNDQIDAGYTWEPVTTDAINNGYKVVYTSETVGSLFIPDGIVFRASVVEERPEDVRAFLKAWFEAVEYRKNKPEEANQLIAKFLNVPADQVVPDEQLQIFTLTDTISLFEANADGSPGFALDVAMTTGDFLMQNAIISNVPAYGTFLDPSFLK
jgi:NitT/TauT family transport system substrate-binding protein